MGGVGMSLHRVAIYWVLNGVVSLFLFGVWGAVWYKSTLHHNCRGNSEVYVEEVDFMGTAIFACIICGGVPVSEHLCVHSFSEIGQTSLARFRWRKRRILQQQNNNYLRCQLIYVWLTKFGLSSASWALSILGLDCWLICLCLDWLKLA